MASEATAIRNLLLLLRKGHPSVVPRIRFIPITQSSQIIANESLMDRCDKEFSEGGVGMLCCRR